MHILLHVCIPLLQAADWVAWKPGHDSWERLSSANQFHTLAWEDKSAPNGYRSYYPRATHYTLAHDPKCVWHLDGPHGYQLQETKMRSLQCQPGPARKYQPVSSMSTTFAPCPTGRFARLEAAIACNHCPPGHAVLHEGMSECGSCLPGQIRSAEGLCMPCWPGSYRDGDKCKQFPSGCTSAMLSFGPDACEATKQFYLPAAGLSLVLMYFFWLLPRLFGWSVPIEDIHTNDNGQTEVRTYGYHHVWAGLSAATPVILQDTDHHEAERDCQRN